MTPDLDGLGEDLTARYELGPALGKGAFGAVVRARERSTGREVAVKLLLAEKSGPARTRFVREAAVAATFDHPGIVKVHAAGRHGGRPCIVYELVEGQTYHQAVRTLGPRRRTELVRDAARAVGHAHARGVVHRDLKPENLLVDRDGRLLVADFGLVLVEGADRLTLTGAFVGTPHYMAPEQFSGDRAMSGPGVDVWALGVVLYEALTGRLPFDGATLVVLAAQVGRCDVTPPSSVDPNVDPAVEAVCLRALSRDPARRYRDGEALAAALDDALAGRASAPRTSTRALAVAGGVLVAAGVTLALAMASRREVPSTEPAPQPATTTPTKRPPPPEPLAATKPGPRLQRHLLRANSGRWATWVDDRRVMTGGQNGGLHLFDAVTGDELRAWEGATIGAVRLDDDRLCLLSLRIGVVLVDPDHPESSRSLVAVAAAKWLCVAATSRRMAVLLGGPEGKRRGRTLTIVAPEGGSTPPFVLPPEANDPIALSSDGLVLAVPLDDDSDRARVAPVLLYDLTDPSAPRLLHTVDVSGRARDVTFARDGRLFVATTLDQVQRIDTRRGVVDTTFLLVSPEVRERAAAHLGQLRCIAVSPDGARLYSAAALEGGDLELKTWDLATCKEAAAPVTLPGEPRRLDVSPNGKLLAISTRSTGVHVQSVAGP